MKRQNQKGMILAIDMGNTNIVIGCVDDEKIYFEERLCTDYSKTELEYAIGFKTVLELYNIESEQIHGAIISSVVPQLVNVIKSAVEKIIGITPLIVGPGVKTGLNLLMDQPKQVGTDMVVDAVAAIHEYGAPVLIIDVGTATTISAVDDKKNYVGGAILPGIRVSVDSLVSRIGRSSGRVIRPSATRGVCPARTGRTEAGNDSDPHPEPCSPKTYRCPLCLAGSRKRLGASHSDPVVPSSSPTGTFAATCGGCFSRQTAESWI